MNLLKKILIVSLIVSLPINILGVVWATKTFDTYKQLEKFSFTIKKGNRLFTAGNSQFYDLLYTINSLLGINKPTQAHLIIKNKDLNELDSNLPLSGSDYKKNAILFLDNKPIKGQVKYRGDHFFHWLFPRKSWRFKTSKKQIHQGINKYNFIIPKSVEMQLNNLSYKLAKIMGLLAPDSRLLELSINGVYNGPRLMVEQIDESFLRKNRRMPNDIYKGDNIGQSKYQGVNVLIFNDASLWEKAAYNNHYDRESKVPLETILSDINLGQYHNLDLESFARMAAYIDITGSYHHDRSHNWILYYDSYFEKMFPIIWDTVGWVNHTLKMDHLNIATSELLEFLYKDYKFMRLKYKSLLKFYKNHKINFIGLLTESIRDSKEIINQNKHSFNLNRIKFNLEQSDYKFKEFLEGTHKRINLVEEYFLGPVNSSLYKYSIIDNKVRLSISGPSLVREINIKTKQPSSFNDVKISYLQSLKQKTVNVTNKVSLMDNNLSIKIPVLANMSQGISYKNTTRINFHEATYDIEINGLQASDIQNISLSFDNLSNETINIQRVEQIEQKAFDARFKNIIPIAEEVETITWSGEKRFSGFNLVEENLEIEPGTKLLFEEGATLKVLGKVTAIGTAEQPIVLDALDSSKPWGAFALKDERANDSVFKHVIFKNGSGDKGELYEYTAMFSVHNVKGLLLEKSEFYDSKLTDDMVHIIYSDVKLKDSKFVRSLSDAVDIDISTAIVENCEFINSGNDSIDLMTSDAIVINTVFKDSKDKAISIGEGSNLLAINNLIENSVIGMQSKDTSLAYIYNTSFIGNDKAIDAYHKNWRYSEGGTIYVDKCVMDENTENATVGKKSKVVINDCLIDTMDNFDKKDIRKGKIIVGDQDYIPATFEQEFFQNHSQLIQKQTQGSYQ